MTTTRCESKSHASAPAMMDQMRAFRFLVLILLVATVLPSLLVGYPTSPLLLPVNHSTSRVKASVATASFIVATSLRTMMMTPLTRLLESNILTTKPFIKKGGSTSLVSNIFVNKMDTIIEGMERFAHRVWEDAARQSGVLLMRYGGDIDRSPIVIDLNIVVPCKADMALAYLLEIRHVMTDGNITCVPEVACRLRDVITRNLLVEYAKTLDDTFDLATHPIILRHLWPAESFHDSNNAVDENIVSIRRRLTPNGIMNDSQLSNLRLPNYFSDAANKTGYAALVPDASASTPTTLSQFLRKILSGDAPYAKIGTQVIIEECPELRDEIIPASLAKELFGWNTYLEDIKMWIGDRWLTKEMRIWFWKIIPPMSYYPVFIASNRCRGAAGTEAHHPRTDLHAEPIGNIASQLHGTRRWTLVPTMWSGLLRPTVSRHRGYFYSNIDPFVKLSKRLKSIPLVYECVTRRGDTIWIPPWVSVSIASPLSLSLDYCSIYNAQIQFVLLDVASRRLRR